MKPGDRAQEQQLYRLVKAYVDEIMQPGIPYVSTSHVTMRAIYGLVGAEAGDALIKSEMEKRA